jgi:hypothetical protein
VIYPYNEVALLARAIYAQDWNTSQTWAQAASALNGVEPDYYFDNMRGLAIFRDQWGANATRIIFQPRSEPGGHSEPDRNHIAFYALGRPWIPFIVNDGSHAPQSGYVSGTTNAEAASTMHIDGYSVSALPAHVDDLNTSNAIYSYATGDATLPMNWQPQTSGGSIVQTWTYAQTQYTPGTYPFYNIPTWETPDWEFSEQDINGYQAINDTNYQMANFPGSAVQYAFRTAGIVRGSDPFAIVTDDVKIDGNSHNYLFRLMTMPDLTISYPSSTQALLTDPATGNKTLIAVINASSTVSFTPNSFPNGITDGAYGAFTWSSVPSLDLAYTSTANPASIRVIIMAIPSGGSLPSIVYSNNVLTVQTSDGVTSTVTFSTATDGHETFSATNVH